MKIEEAEMDQKSYRFLGGGIRLDKNVFIFIFIFIFLQQHKIPKLNP